MDETLPSLAWTGQSLMLNKFVADLRYYVAPFLNEGDSKGKWGRKFGSNILFDSVKLRYQWATCLTKVSRSTQPLDSGKHLIGGGGGLGEPRYGKIFEKMTTAKHKASHSGSIKTGEEKKRKTTRKSY